MHKIFYIIAEVFTRITKLNKKNFVEYLHYLSVYINNSNNVHYVIACIFLDRYLAKTKVVIAKDNIYKLFAIALIVAIKTHSDLIYTNKFYSVVLGMELDELNKLEIDFCFSADFNFVVSKNAYEMYDCALKKVEKY